MRTSSDIKEFYDEFSERVLVQDFRYLNLRQEAIRELCYRFVDNRARVLEVGCGVGINAKTLQEYASYVLAVDISSRNVQITKEFAGSNRCDVRVLDIIEQGDELQAYDKFDVAILPDVVEHIPKERYPDLFSALENALKPNGRIILTYPTPEHQEYLEANTPDVLQVVDEHVELTDILGVTRLKPVYFAYRNVWGRNEYVHLVLSADRAYEPPLDDGSVFSKLMYRIRKYRWRFSNFFFLRRLRKVLAETDGSASADATDYN